MNMHERLKEVRKHVGLTQEKFGEKLGLKQTQVRDIESGKQKVSTELAELMEKYFYISGWWLLTGKGVMLFEEHDKAKNIDGENHMVLKQIDGHIGEKEIELLNDYRSLSKERQELYYLRIKADAIEERITTKPRLEDCAKYA